MAEEKAIVKGGETHACADYCRHRTHIRSHCILSNQRTIGSPGKNYKPERQNTYHEKGIIRPDRQNTKRDKKGSAKSENPG